MYSHSFSVDKTLIHMDVSGKNISTGSGKDLQIDNEAA
jgi:hypothetical protein